MNDNTNDRDDERPRRDDASQRPTRRPYSRPGQSSQGRSSGARRPYGGSRGGDVSRDSRDAPGGRGRFGGERSREQRDDRGRPSRAEKRRPYGDGGRPIGRGTGSADEAREAPRERVDRAGSTGGIRGFERQGHAPRGGRANRGSRFDDRDPRRVQQAWEEARGGSRLVPKEGRKPEPRIDEDVTGFELERSVKNQLRTLSKENALGVQQHLVMAARLLDTDEMGALAHAETAVRRAGRVPAAREALGLVHYRMGEWAKALNEFRTARRLSGSHHLLPFMVDCERALGRPEKALELAQGPEAGALPQEDRIELLIVISGIRRDLGQLEAAKVELEVPALRQGVNKPWYARLAYAYADALLALEDEDGAVEWFHKAAQADHDGETDADERLEALEGFSFTDLLEGEGDDDE